MNAPAVALTIAGSDSGGGAGLQTDLKTFAAFGVFGTSAVTAVTVQNTVGVRAIHPVPADVVDGQIAAVLDDLPVAAVKTGMLADLSILDVVASRAPALPNLVVDPVLVASSGDSLFPPELTAAYLKLFAHATVVTPNLREASVLVGRRLSTVDGMTAAAEELAATGAGCVVVKGGHLPGDACVDVVWHAGSVTTLSEKRIDTRNNHGTGCTFAAAVAARLASGDALPDALAAAKRYVTRALAGAATWRLGTGHGPLSWEVPQ